MTKLKALTSTLLTTALLLLATACDTAPPAQAPSGQPGKYCPTKDNPNKLCDGMAPRG